MNHYETMFIISPLLTEDQMKEVAGKFRDYLTSNQAEIVHEENWGLRKLAYPIKKKSTGFYHLIEYRANPALIERLEIEFRRDERIMRFLTNAFDKFAIEFSARRRRGEFNRDRKRNEDLAVIERNAETESKN
jgi:small subunit ribosomal protein S6